MPSHSRLVCGLLEELLRCQYKPGYLLMPTAQCHVDPVENGILWPQMWTHNSVFSY